MKHSKFIITGEAPVISFPCLIQAFGRSESELLQKIHYLIFYSTLSYAGDYRIQRKEHSKKKFIGLSYEAIVEVMGNMSLSTVKRAVKRLRESGILIVEKLSVSVWERLNFYRVDYHKLEDLLGLNFLDNKPDDEKPEEYIELKENLNCGITRKIKVARQKNVIPPTPYDLAVGEGSAEPKCPQAPQHQLDAQPKAVVELYRMLRGYRVDISLAHEIFKRADKASLNVVATHILSRKSGIDGLTWHTPEQLQLENVFWRI